MSTHPHITVSAMSLAGETLSAVAVSPSIIILRPPEKLVLEITTSGRYLFTSWSRNGVTLGNSGFGISSSRRVVDFGDIYFSDNTTEEDLAEYEVVLNPASSSDQVIDGVAFTVIAPGKSC